MKLGGGIVGAGIGGGTKTGGGTKGATSLGDGLSLLGSGTGEVGAKFCSGFAG